MICLILCLLFVCGKFHALLHAVFLAVNVIVERAIPGLCDRIFRVLPATKFRHVLCLPFIISRPAFSEAISYKYSCVAVNGTTGDIISAVLTITILTTKNIPSVIMITNFLVCKRSF